MNDQQALFKPLQLKHLTLRNRIMSTSHAVGYAEDGMPGERYQLYQAEKAKGGIGLTMFGGSSSVAADSPLTFNQIDVSTDRVIPYLEKMAEGIHAHGAHTFCQITHLGRRGRWDVRDWLPLINPSTNREPQHRAYSKEMEDFDFKRVLRQFREAAVRVKNAGIDGVELIASAHHLVDSFLSPIVNQRTDKYGGSLENRMRFGFEVFEELRAAVGDDFILGARIAGDELLSNGLSESECLKIITGYCNSGLLDYINVYQSNGDSFRGLVGMMPDMAYDSGAFLYLASGVKAEVDIPVFHGSAIRDVATAARAVAEGHVDMIAMTRAHIADPHIVNKMREGRDDDIRQCVGANYCVDRANGALCIQNASTGREKTMPHDVGRSTVPKKIVVVGGGPAGLEAARVAAARGHTVVLFEKEAQLGGQLRLARALSWRENLSGITRWLEMQNRKLGVDIRLSTAATEAAILAEAPDVVIIATGGTVAPPEFEGSQYMVSSWDILSGKVKPGENVIVYDITGQHQGATVADFMAERGSLVEIVTPDQMIGEEIGGLARVHFMKRLYKNKVIMTISQKINKVYLEGNSMIAVLQEEYSDLQEEREVTQIVYEQGSFPAADLYFALRPQSINMGELDQTAFIAVAPQALVNNPQGKFQLFRIGDAIHSRNVHASIYDGSRLMRAF